VRERLAIWIKLKIDHVIEKIVIPASIIGLLSFLLMIHPNQDVEFRYFQKPFHTSLALVLLPSPFNVHPIFQTAGVVAFQDPMQKQFKITTEIYPHPGYPA